MQYFFYHLGVPGIKGDVGKWLRAMFKTIWLMFILGDAGGCGICPAAVAGLQGDRGSQGYRGRPGVSIHQ